MLSIDTHLKVEMRAGAPTGTAYFADALTLGNRLAVTYAKTAQVAVQSRQPLTVVDYYGLSIGSHPAGKNHCAAVRRYYFGTHGRPYIHSGMHSASLQYGVVTHPVRRGYARVTRGRPGKDSGA